MSSVSIAAGKVADPVPGLGVPQDLARFYFLQIRAGIVSSSQRQSLTPGLPSEPLHCSPRFETGQRSSRIRRTPEDRRLWGELAVSDRGQALVVKGDVGGAALPSPGGECSVARSGAGVLAEKRGGNGAFRKLEYEFPELPENRREQKAARCSMQLTTGQRS
jgi:hypothetical protein